MEYKCTSCKVDHLLGKPQVGKCYQCAILYGMLTQLIHATMISYNEGWVSHAPTLTYGTMN